MMMMILMMMMMMMIKKEIKSNALCLRAVLRDMCWVHVYFPHAQRAFPQDECRRQVWDSHRKGQCCQVCAGLRCSSPVYRDRPSE